MFTTRPEIIGTFGAVASTHWLASQVGMAVRERGGDAFDADRVRQRRALREENAFGNDADTEREGYRRADEGAAAQLAGAGEILVGHF